MKNLNKILKKLFAVSAEKAYRCCCTKVSDNSPLPCRTLMLDASGNAVGGHECGMVPGGNGNTPDPTISCNMSTGDCTLSPCGYPDITQQPTTAPTRPTGPNRPTSTPTVRGFIGCDGSPLAIPFPKLSGKRDCNAILAHYKKLEDALETCKSNCTGSEQGPGYSFEECLKTITTAATVDQLNLLNTTQPISIPSDDPCKLSRQRCHCKFQYLRYQYFIQIAKQAELYANGCKPFQIKQFANPAQQDAYEQGLINKIKENCKKLQKTFPGGQKTEWDNQCAQKSPGDYIYGQDCKKSCNCPP